MPTYEYKCEACGNKFEKFQSITAPAIRKCPVCGKNRVKRLIGTGAGLIFKGGGFYETDYRSEAYKTAAKADSGAPPAAKDSKDSKESSGSTAAGSGKSESSSKPAGESKTTPAKSTDESKPAPPKATKGKESRRE
jgi:putative FmdB family regulatory protein